MIVDMNIAVAKKEGYTVFSEILDDGTQKLVIYSPNYTPPKYHRTFAKNTPAQIDIVSAEISANNYTSAQVAEIYGWNLGDTMPITLSTGEKIEMQIIGFNHDDKSDGTGKAGITLQMKNCLKTARVINTESNAGGYAASKMKTETLPTVYTSLPERWRNVIKLVDKKSANGGASNYTETLTLSEDIFLLSSIEMNSSSFAQDRDNEGNPYEYWIDKVDDDRIKLYDKDGNGLPETITAWWLRSSSTVSSGHFCAVSTTGSFVSTSVTSGYRISFAFCV